MVRLIFAVTAMILISWSAFKYIKFRNNSFSNESAQTRFMSFATQIAPLRRIELAKVSQLEVFERKSEAHLFWSKLKLPDVVVSATVPVEYRYTVGLEDAWQIRSFDQEIEIVAPALTPSTPAADISQLRFDVKEGSVFRNEQKVSEALQSELTALLEKRAIDNRDLIIETARKELDDLAQAWLKKENAQAKKIKVRFANEGGSNKTQP